jgi:hypothetical protein
MTIAATDLQSAKLNDLANKLKLTRYDLLLIGDGAGTTLGYALRIWLCSL